MTINDGSASGTYDNVTLYYNPNAKGILGTTTGVYYAVADGHTFVNAINSYPLSSGLLIFTSPIGTALRSNSLMSVWESD